MEKFIKCLKNPESGVPLTVFALSFSWLGVAFVGIKTILVGNTDFELMLIAASIMTILFTPILIHQMKMVNKQS